MKEKKTLVTEGLLCYTTMLAGAVERAFKYPEEFTLDRQELELAEKILTEVGTILEARKKREAYTAYKTAEKNTADREALRQEYLDLAGIHSKWRSDTEKTP